MPTDCTTFEALIVRAGIDPLPPEETARLEIHLRRCDRCRTYRQALTQLPAALRIEEDAPPADPALLMAARQRMHARRGRLGFPFCLLPAVILVHNSGDQWDVDKSFLYSLRINVPRARGC